MKSSLKKTLFSGLLILCLFTLALELGTSHYASNFSNSSSTTYYNTQEYVMKTGSATSITLATKSLSVNVTLNSTQVVRGTFIGINVSITDNKTPVRVSNISMFYKRGNVEYNTTEFQESSKGVYSATVNTTSLSPGWWKVKVLVEKGGTTIENTDTRFAVLLTLKKREYPYPLFIGLITLSTIVVVVAITYASRNLSTLEEEVKP